MGHLPEADGAPVSSNIGAYKVLETLGAGGMGIVYLAEPLGGGTRVALKTVTSRSEAVLYGIRREVQALRALDHPGVVRVLDVGTHKGAPYYAMEALDGPTLRSYRRARARTPDPTRVDTADIEAMVPSSEARPASGSRAAAPDELRAHALAVIRSVCETLAFVHGRGIVHRDLKPDNVILTEDRGPVLVDFGIAALALGSRTREVLETAGRTYGSPGYMAPEQIRGELVDARADLYAIGSMLFECVTGRLPFEGEAVRTLLSKKLHGEAPRASRYVPDLSVALDDLIARLLSRKKEDRPGHAIDVAAALADLGAGRIGPSGPPGEPYLYRPRISGRDDAMGRIDRAMSTATASRGFATPAGEIEVTSARPRPTPTIVDRPLVSTHVRTSLPVEIDLTLDVTSATEAPFSQGAVVLVGGESGVGKTRLVMEAALRGAQRGFKVVTGECVHVGSDEDAAHGLVGRALHPFRGFLQAVVDACSDASDLESLLGPHARLLAAFEPALATLEGFDAQPEPESVPPEAARARVNEAVFAVLAAFAQRTPTLLVLDDLQWADEPSLRLLESLERSRLRELPLVVLATYRADEAPPLLRAIASSPDVVDIRLSRLGSASLLAIVRDMLAIDEVDPELAAFIESESDGNPFFVAEWLRAAVERGLLVRDARGRFRLDLQSKHLLASIPAPRALGEIVETRLARLDADALAITRMSAVLGRDAAAGVLAAALGMPDVMGSGAVTELLRRDVFEEKDGTLRFVHDKLREAAYAAIPAADRPRMHRAAARALEHHAFSAGDEDRWTNELAHHWAEAGEAELALPLLDRAGELAARAGSYGDALRCFERALSLFTDAAPLEPSRRAERARWVRRAAEAHHATGDLRAAELRGREALRLATGGPTILDRSYESGRGARLAFVAAAGAAVLAQVRSASRPVVAPAPSAEHELHREAALAAEKLGQTYLFLNDSTRAGLATVLAGNHAAALGPSPELARASAQLAIAASYVPAHGYARRYVARAHEIASDLGEPDTQLMVSFMRGFWGLGASDGA
ncbi:MAG TPA: protein kinase, partial [Polyangiaceae bacterium]|nr:protein kinase [Polyangiaceae bacterium]